MAGLMRREGTVPPQIGKGSAIHKLYLAVMIFLFGLALRNMLKIK